MPRANPVIPGVLDRERFDRANRAWQDLCERFLPITHENSLWRFSRQPLPDDPEQGWKLHISATVLNAHVVLERVAPLLIGCGVQFKATATLNQLRDINTGLLHGYSQIGKFLTVYPRTTEESVCLAAQLHELTLNCQAPVIPFDKRFTPDSNVYYRYGAFKLLKLETAEGLATNAIRDPLNNLVPDQRDSEKAHPDWIKNPFPQPAISQPGSELNPLKTTYRVFRALSQRGKGGVYQAVDLSSQPPRFCLLKEGRQLGELSWDGRDGRWRVEQEKRVLCQLNELGVRVPDVYDSFYLNRNFYLVTEFIAGESLQSLLDRQQRRLSISRALRYGYEITLLLDSIHSVGWVWRDCKPANLMRTRRGDWRPLDFEGACPINQPKDFLWRTPAYTPPQSANSESTASPKDDFYALGVILYQMLTGILPNVEMIEPISKLRCGVPHAVNELIKDLLAVTPPPVSARTIASRLKNMISVE